MKKTFSKLFWERVVWVWVICVPIAIGGSFSTGAIDTVARANAATAQATANAAEPTASLPAYLASPPPIGGTTPAAGSFTTLASPSVNLTGGTIGSAVTGGAGLVPTNATNTTYVVGSLSNTATPAGMVGERILGAQVSSSTVGWIVSPAITVTPGWWKITGHAMCSPSNVTTVITYMLASISVENSAGWVISGNGDNASHYFGTSAAVATVMDTDVDWRSGTSGNPVEFYFSSNTTFYAKGYCSFSTSTATQWAWAEAIRVK